MDETCDWEVCTEAAVPGPLPQLSSRTEKKRRAKSVTNQASDHKDQRTPERTHPAPRGGKENHGDVSPARDAPVQSLPQTLPTRKELQDALPKIPPLSSFKSCKSRFVTLEEAEQDFHSFITTGLGRSVEIIREFRGQEGDDEGNGHRETVVLHDDTAPSLKRNGQRWKSDFPRPRRMSGSPSGEEDGESRVMRQTETEAKPPPPAIRAKAETANNTACTTSAPQTYPQTTRPSNGRASSHPEDQKPAPAVKSNRRANQATPTAQSSRHQSRKNKDKRRKKISGETIREKKGRERDEVVCDYDEEEGQGEEEEEWSPEAYWRASYRAWRDYYSSMSPLQEPGYHSYYSAAHNWMAAYRMNAVYVEELLKY